MAMTMARTSIAAIPVGLLFAMLISLLDGAPGVVRVGAAGSCESLTSLKLSGGTITTAAAVPAGGFTQPGADPGQRNAAAQKLPAFCRIAARCAPLATNHTSYPAWARRPP